MTTRPSPMPHRYWLHIIAIGGYLVWAIFWAGAALAQEAGSPVGPEDPAPQAEDAQPQEAPPEEPPPVTPDEQVPAPVDEPPRHEPNYYADADLNAQQDMARWARQMVYVSAVSVGIAGFAVVLVFLTLREAKNTTKVAKTALEITQDSSERQLRAYIDITTARVEWTGNNAITRIITKNAGQTPAHKVTHWVKGSVGVENEFVPLNDADRANLQKWTQGPGIDGYHAWSFPPFLPGNDPRTDSIRIPLNVWGEIKYEDVFGNERFTKYRLIMAINPADPTQFILAPCKDGNKST